MREMCKRLDNVVCTEEDGDVSSEPKSEAATIENNQERHFIQDVVLLGAPVNTNSGMWRHMRNMVSGRIVNGYSKSDLVLGLIYR